MNRLNRQSSRSAADQDDPETHQVEIYLTELGALSGSSSPSAFPNVFDADSYRYTLTLFRRGARRLCFVPLRFGRTISVKTTILLRLQIPLKLA